MLGPSPQSFSLSHKEGNGDAQTANIQKPNWLLEMESILQMLNEGVIIADDGLRLLFVNDVLLRWVVINAEICWVVRQQLPFHLKISRTCRLATNRYIGARDARMQIDVEKSSYHHYTIPCRDSGWAILRRTESARECGSNSRCAAKSNGLYDFVLHFLMTNN